jgi:hypothetical protein
MVRSTRFGRKQQNFEEAGVDQVIFVSRIASVRDEQICWSLDLFEHATIGDFRGREAVDMQKLEQAERMEAIVEPVIQRERAPEIGQTAIRAGMGS